MILESLLYEWISLFLRWAHVIAALAWIGASFYLISWENKFNRVKNLRTGVEGDFWTIQGGDFYFVEKLKGAPVKIPDELHWFKYEAYLTWLSGFALLTIYYYANASQMMLAPQSPLQAPTQAIVASISSLVMVWLLYALYCRTPLARNLQFSALFGLVCICLLSWLYCYLFNGRAAFLHLGAAMATVMSANVFFSIIPWHKRLLKAMKDKSPLDGVYASHPGFRSRHNHYMTLPVLFLMLAAHAPFASNGPYNWLIATLLVVSAGLLKHFHSCLQKQQAWGVYLAAGLVVFGFAIVLSASEDTRQRHCGAPVAFSSLAEMIDRRCSACHTGGNNESGVLLGTPAQVRAVGDRINARVVLQKSMPVANASGMLDHERDMLACWLEQAPELP